MLRIKQLNFFSGNFFITVYKIKFSTNVNIFYFETGKVLVTCCNRFVSKSDCSII